MSQIMDDAVMPERLRYSTHIHKLPCSNLGQMTNGCLSRITRTIAYGLRG